jgi:hypothetical protein
MMASGIHDDARQLHVIEHHNRMRVEILTLDKQRRLIRRNARGRDDRLVGALGRGDSNRGNHHH